MYLVDWSVLLAFKILFTKEASEFEVIFNFSSDDNGFVVKKLQISMAQNPIALVSTQDIYSLGFRVRVFWVEGLGFMVYDLGF